MHYKMSKSEWNRIGIKAGWIKEAQSDTVEELDADGYDYNGYDSKGNKKPSNLTELMRTTNSLEVAMKLLAENIKTERVRATSEDYQKAVDFLLLHILLDNDKVDFVTDWQEVKKQFTSY